jgi:hypothetical protein
MLSGFDFFKIYHSLHLHFTSSKYDVLKYNGRTNVSFEVFDRRRDSMRFNSFAHKLIGKNKAGRFCIANFVYGSKNFIYEPYDDAYEVYMKWKKVRESITRTFEKDVSYLNTLASSRAAFDLFAKTKKGNYPPILQVVLGGHISIETVCILDKEHKEFFDNWKEICQNDPYVEKELLKWKKYQPFVQYDADKINPILDGALF